MHFIVKLFPEITIKSAPVRKRFTRQLQNNLRSLLKPLDATVKVIRDWEKIDVVSENDDEQVIAKAKDILSCTPGVAFFYEVSAFTYEDMHDIYEKTASIWLDALEGKTFCVRVKRSGDQEFSSIDVEKYVGGGLNQHSKALGVKLKGADVTVKMEIKNQNLYVVREQIAGLGGFPLGTQDPVLSLISGGFDSTVASYLTIKRGLRTHFCFFSLGGRDHEIGCKEVAYYLWHKFGASHQVRFVTVPFEEVVGEILTKVSDANMGVILKRMMLRAATKVAEHQGIQALVTGEAVAQVSSQTLTNLSIIDRVTDTLVMRPLVTMDKGDIIDISRQIGAEEFAANMPEYCGVISRKPTTRAKIDKVESEEQGFDFNILEQAIEKAKVEPIQQVMAVADGDLEVDEFTYLPTDAVLIDIRHPDEIEAAPLQLGVSAETLEIPFYALLKQADELPKRQYLLYCDQGVMSKMHASHLLNGGVGNFGVYRKPSKS
ncbi:tRNA uracil 4-sulfurtransferase ThiI [Sessilibacter corallicola]|uniref:tRNA uracil 4-sulfurtransferase ThiI n=1 Tax=Sessilibacter corallicola TaxID=2904075 RepID=UPI001E43FAB1|nr:tRNA uracil 4-sulfurtransferase ThiI [Sessilibacter corallicola]MCE2027783.1 tRNA 4-thiouridine(8) synthase ThiI [Sessilibacter corallicola]